MFRKRTFIERCWEILPGLSFWVVFLGAIFLSRYQPLWASLFIIVFDLYWVIKALNVATHLIASYRIFRHHVTVNWLDYVERLGSDFPGFLSFINAQAGRERTRVGRNFYRREWQRLRTWSAGGRIPKRYSEFYQLIILPFVDESVEVLATSLSSLADAHYPKDKMIIILATEERAGQAAQGVAEELKQKFGQKFNNLFVTIHPDGLPDEIRGKSANTSYAVSAVMPELQRLGIAVDQVIVSNFDSDTVVHPQYFARVMYEFLTADKPYQSSFQPIAIYNNNIWDSPSFIRVVSVSNSFWQFTESSRPDRLRTFSSHSMTLRALVDVGFWKKDIINEDGYIFWQCYLHYNGDYRVVPLFIPISLDTCLADTFWQTLKNQYKQKRRWAYNVEYYPHLIWPLIRSQARLRDKALKLFQYVEGNFNWATASILISTLGLLPLFLGGQVFLDSVVAYNLPAVTRILMRVALVFLIFSVYINMVLLPPRPSKYGPWRTVTMYLQWFLVPLVSVVFGSMPAIEAQTRLMFGWYLEFWVTPKTRKGAGTGLTMREMQSAGIRNQES